MSKDDKADMQTHATCDVLTNVKPNNTDVDVETLQKIMNNDVKNLEKYYGEPIKVKSSYSHFLVDYKDQEKQTELNDTQKNNIDITTTQLTKNNDTSQANISQLNAKDANQNNVQNPQTNNGFYSKTKNWMGGVWTKMKNVNWNPFKAQEIECIDAHGHKYKRPVNKIPLRKKKPQTMDEKNVRFTADLGMYYASQQTTGFGTFFV